MSAATMPACLLRTAADDREEAERVTASNSMMLEVALESSIATGIFVRSLAQVQSIQALQVDAAWRGAPRGTSLYDAAREALNALFGTQEPRMTLDQRGALLDAARALVRLAREVDQ